jgi:hypothetical protein
VARTAIQTSQDGRPGQHGGRRLRRLVASGLIQSAFRSIRAILRQVDGENNILQQAACRMAIVRATLGVGMSSVGNRLVSSRVRAVGADGKGRQERRRLASCVGRERTGVRLPSGMSLTAATRRGNCPLPRSIRPTSQPPAWCGMRVPRPENEDRRDDFRPSELGPYFAIHSPEVSIQICAATSPLTRRFAAVCSCSVRPDTSARGRPSCRAAAAAWKRRSAFTEVRRFFLDLDA